MKFEVRDLGIAGYREVYELQLQLADDIAHGRQSSTLLLVEHYPVLTLGANFRDENLKLSSDQYAERGIDVISTDRGGDVTYHGPGQLVQYPVFDLGEWNRDLHRWLRALEQTQLEILHQFGLEGYRFPPHTGVWIRERKIAAIGIKVKRWISIHGIALNVEQTPEAFEWIVPCGIAGYGVTSLAAELNRQVSLAEAKTAAKAAFSSVFGSTAADSAGT